MGRQTSSIGHIVPAKRIVAGRLHPQEPENVSEMSHRVSVGLTCTVKNPEGDLAIGAFNVLDVDGLIKQLCSLRSPNDEQLHCIVQAREDERFRMIKSADEIAK